jgi:hypothetical protein
MGELHGHTVCPSSRNNNLSVDQSFPVTDDLSVIQMNHFVTYICSGPFCALFKYSAQATKHLYTKVQLTKAKTTFL